MKKLFAFLAATLLASCTWVSYDDNGQTRWRQKYPTGTPTYYEDGTYQRDHRYHDTAPFKKPSSTNRQQCLIQQNNIQAA